MTKTALKSIDEAQLAPNDMEVGEGVYDLFRKMRETGPVARTEIGVTLALRNRHFELVTSDATRQMELETALLQGITDGPIFELSRLAMLFANGEAHKRRRRPVAQTFAFKMMEAMRPRVRELAEEMICEQLDKGPIDFVGDVAAIYPARLIAEILGIPRADVPTFRKWIQHTASAIGFIDLRERKQIEESLDEFNAYVSELLAQRRADPKEDFITEYIRKTAEQGDLEEDEIRTQLMGLILAGSDTTRGSVCMILAELLQHPEQFADLVADPEGLKRAAVEEGMRFKPIISGIPRVAVRDLEIDGYVIPEGAVVAISVISALRDPEVFDDPETFNIHRTDQQRWHYGFGAGVHRCVGEALARVEMEEMIAAIARLAPRSELIGPPPGLAPGPIRQVGPMSVSLKA